LIAEIGVIYVRKLDGWEDRNWIMRGAIAYVEILSLSVSGLKLTSVK